MENNSVAGKLAPALCVDSFLSKQGAPRSEVRIGPQIGVDVSVVQISDTLGMALTSDPLSLIPTLGLQESAWLSVQLMANDMGTTGHAPQYAQFVLNLPTSLSDQDYQTYWSYIDTYCKQLGVNITGGHTGRVDGQNSTIAGGGTMVTVAPLATLLTSTRASAGDQLIVIGEAAIISTAILAMSFPKTVQQAIGMELWQQACELFYQSSSLPVALELVQTFPDAIVAMHDVTEGGIMGAIQEMALASQTSVEIFQEQIVVGTAQRQVMNHFQIDPLYCVGTGALAVAVRSEFVTQVVNELRQKGYTASHVGRFDVATATSKRIVQGTSLPLEPLYDPYWQTFQQAMLQQLT